MAPEAGGLEAARDLIRRLRATPEASDAASGMEALRALKESPPESQPPGHQPYAWVVSSQDVPGAGEYRARTFFMARDFSIHEYDNASDAPSDIPPLCPRGEVPMDRLTVPLDLLVPPGESLHGARWRPSGKEYLEPTLDIDFYCRAHSQIESTGRGRRRGASSPVTAAFPARSVSLRAQCERGVWDGSGAARTQEWEERGFQGHPWRFFQHLTQLDDEVESPLDVHRKLRLSLQMEDMNRRWGNAFLRKYPLTDGCERVRALPESVPYERQQSFSPFSQ